MTRHILVLLLNSAFVGGTEAACGVLLTLMYPTEIEYGGLGLSSYTIGVIMSFIGIMLGVSSLIIYPWLMARYSAKQVYRVCYAGYLASPILFSLMNFIARRRGAVDTPVWVLIGLQLLTGSVSVHAFGEWCIHHCMLAYINQPCLRHHVSVAEPSDAWGIDGCYQRSRADCSMLHQNVCTTCDLCIVLAVARKECAWGDNGVFVA